MQPPTAMQVSSRIFREVFPAVLLLCLALSSCGNSCYSGFWNGNGSGAAVSNTSCPLAPATGNVSVQISGTSASSGASTSSAALASVPSSRDIQHIYITLRGVDAHASSAAGDAASGWQQLVPALASHPAQVDLLAMNSNSRLPVSSSSAIAPSAFSANVSATVPTDEYRQLRARLVALQQTPDEVTPERNVCGSVGWNCVVFADGSMRPLEFGSGAAEIKITPARGDENLFRVLPGESVYLSIEFDPKSSAFFLSNAAVRMVPVFRVVTRDP
jgi:hypothetical protein